MLVKGTKYRFFKKIITPSNCSYYEFKTYFTFLNYQNGQMHSTLMHSNDSKCENMNEVNLDVCLESCIHSAPYRLFHLHLFGLCCRWSRSSIEGPGVCWLMRVLTRESSYSRRMCDHSIWQFTTHKPPMGSPHVDLLARCWLNLWTLIFSTVYLLNTDMHFSYLPREAEGRVNSTTGHTRESNARHYYSLGLFVQNAIHFT